MVCCLKLRGVHMNHVDFNIFKHRVINESVTSSEISSVKNMFTSLFKAKQKHYRTWTTFELEYFNFLKKKKTVQNKRKNDY